MFEIPDSLFRIEIESTGGGGRFSRIKDQGKVADGDEVVGFQRDNSLDSLTVQESPVLAAGIPQGPLIAEVFKNKMVAGKTGILRARKFIFAGSTQAPGWSKNLQILSPPVWVSDAKSCLRVRKHCPFWLGGCAHGFQTPPLAKVPCLIANQCTLRIQKSNENLFFC